MSTTFLPRCSEAEAQAATLRDKLKAILAEALLLLLIGSEARRMRWPSSTLHPAPCGAWKAG